MAATDFRRPAVVRPNLTLTEDSDLELAHSFGGYGPELFEHFFRHSQPQGVNILSVRTSRPPGFWHDDTPTASIAYDGPRGDGASCMIYMEALAPNRAYFNLVLEDDQGERRDTEIKFDGRQLRCYGGHALADSTTVAPTVHARRWLHLEAIIDDGPPPRLLLRVDGALIYAMPLRARVRLTKIILKGWTRRHVTTHYARLTITDSVACAAARFAALWLLRRTIPDVALVVLGYAVPVALLESLRASSPVLRGPNRARDNSPLPTPPADGGSPGSSQFLYGN